MLKIQGTDPKVFETKVFGVIVATPFNRYYAAPSTASFERMLERARPGTGAVVVEGRGHTRSSMLSVFDVLVDVENVRALRSALELIEEQNSDYAFTVVAPKW